jgi:hypothetical protein
MARVASDAVLDGLLDVIATATELYVCTDEPTSRANADSLSLIAPHTLTSGDFTNADGDVSGRKVTIAQQADLTLDATGTADHIALCTSTDLLYVTVCTPQALTSGGTVTVPAWDVEVADPSAP